VSWDLKAAGLPTTDPELASLSVDLHDSAVLCRAASTFKTYSGPWKHYKQWCQEKGVPSLPSSPLTVALYMMRLLRTAKTPAPLLTFSGAVYLNHSLAGLPSPTNHPLVSMARETARRIKNAGTNQKRPSLASQIRRLFELWGGPSATLHQLMQLSAITLCYTSFFRYDDLVSVQWQSIKFVSRSHMELLVPDSKTDQYHRGATIYVAHLGGPYCPVGLVQRLLSAGQYRSHGNGPLIRSVLVCPPLQHIKSTAPCYSTVNFWFKHAASTLGLDPQSYGTHSGRRGGATGAAANDVSDRLFKGHGRWRSERAKDMYVKEKLQAKISVTRNLGLQEDIPIAQLRVFTLIFSVIQVFLRYAYLNSPLPLYYSSPCPLPLLSYLSISTLTTCFCDSVKPCTSHLPISCLLNFTSVRCSA
jgi:hypothetical protein